MQKNISFLTKRIDVAKMNEKSNEYALSLDEDNIIGLPDSDHAQLVYKWQPEHLLINSFTCNRQRYLRQKSLQHTKPSDRVKKSFVGTRSVEN